MIYEKNDVSISKDLARFGNAKYPINNISSYSVLKTDIPHGVKRIVLGGLLLAYTALLIIVAMYNFNFKELGYLIFPAVIGGGLFYSGFTSKDEIIYSLKIAAAGGESQVFQTKNKMHIDEIESALDLAMKES